MPAATKKQRGKKKKAPAPASTVAVRPPGLLARMASEAKRVLLPDGIVERRVLLGILLLAFGVRTIGLTESMPIIGDESIYMHWAEIVEHQGEWFISLLDAKPPLQTWLLAVARMLIGVDPLLEARLISVGAALLGTIGLFAIGKLLGSDAAGLITAGLYAVFPIAVFHDRLAYTESLVNFFGIALVAASLWTFERPKPSWWKFLVLGLVLGLGVFTKQSVLLFVHVPLLVALWRGRSSPGRALIGCVMVYAIAGLFFGVTMVATPEGPDTDWRNPALHRSDYYVSKAQLLDEPFRTLPFNWQRLRRSIEAFLTWPTLLAGPVALLYLVWRKPFAALMLVSVSVIPLGAQCILLAGTLYPSRWAFPHFWPFLSLVGLAAVEVWQRYSGLVDSPRTKRLTALAAALLLVAPMGRHAFETIRRPESALRAGAFMGVRAHVGYGNREAVEFLQAEAAKGPFVLLTDPIPGPPGDSMFPYLNQRYGITVYEAWWMKLAPNHPILPFGRTDIMKSQYQRITDKIVDFARVRRVYYVTDTFYHTEEAVTDRQPNATQVASFPKPFNDEAVEVYRLR